MLCWVGCGSGAGAVAEKAEGVAEWCMGWDCGEGGEVIGEGGTVVRVVGWCTGWYCNGTVVRFHGWC